ncbi:MAG: hypothetical protein ACREEK_03025, partial [Bradyrhizobium sp.]
HGNHNPGVGGSSPSLATNKISTFGIVSYHGSYHIPRLLNRFESSGSFERRFTGSMSRVLDLLAMVRIARAALEQAEASSARD